MYMLTYHTEQYRTSIDYPKTFWVLKEGLELSFKNLIL